MQMRELGTRAIVVVFAAATAENFPSGNRRNLRAGYFTFRFLRMNVGTSRSSPSMIVGSLLSKRPRTAFSVGAGFGRGRSCRNGRRRCRWTIRGR